MKVIEAMVRARKLTAIIKKLKAEKEVVLFEGDLPMLEAFKEHEESTIRSYPSRVRGRRASRLNREDNYWRQRKQEETDEVLSEVKEYLKQQD